MPQWKLSDSRTMWALLLVGSLLGVLLLGLSSRSLDPDAITRAGIEHWVLLGVVVISTTCLTGAPFIRFLSEGWDTRLNEFKNRIRAKAILAYLSQFWQKRLDIEMDHPAPGSKPKTTEEIFNEIYVSQYGRGAFVAPIILLLAITFVSSTLVVQTGIDTCVEHRCLPATTNSPTGNSTSSPSTTPSSGQLQLTQAPRGATSISAAPGTGGRFAPMGDITLPRVAAAAIGGAFLFVVGDAILRTRWRTMNISDVYWYALRMALAIPMGLALSEIAAPAVAGLVAFGLGAFPIAAVLKLFQRLTSKSLGGVDEKQEPDQLVQLDGVTVPIAATLAADGVESIDELIGADPVLLSIRSGIPLSSILRFASQAVVRLHIGERANLLVPIGLGNAYFISKFIEELDKQRKDYVFPKSAEKRLLDAVAQLQKSTADKVSLADKVPSKETVEACFRMIADNGYAKFLQAID